MITNNEPLTWACVCGQMNLLTDHECLACGGQKDECWDEEDKSRAIYRGKPGDGPTDWKLVGFRHKDG